MLRSVPETMPVIKEPLGNVVGDKRLATRHRRMKAAGKCEILYLSRHELERFRIRRITDMGTEIRFVRDHSSALRHGDVLLDSDKAFIIVEQLAERVISATIDPGTKPSKAVEVAALLAHSIGNRHRPIAVKDRVISFPVLSDSELELFNRLAKPIRKHVRLAVQRTVFEPNSVGEVHDHP